MMDYILDYLENEGVQIESGQEQHKLENGIRMYLEENGIDTSETRPYFRRFVDAHLTLIDKDDLKSYFIAFPQLSKVKQIAIEYKNDGSVDSNRVEELYKLMSALHCMSLGEKYVPAIEIREILGKYTEDLLNSADELKSKHIIIEKYISEELGRGIDDKFLLKKCNEILDTSNKLLKKLSRYNDAKHIRCNRYKDMYTIYSLITDAYRTSVIMQDYITQLRRNEFSA